MANTKISALTAATALAGTETLPVVQGGATTKATVQQVVTAATGATVMSGATVTVSSKPLIDHAQTWNDGTVIFTGWKLNVTKTAAAAGSLLFDLQTGGQTQFKVDPDGALDVYASVQNAILIGLRGTNILTANGTNFDVKAANLRLSSSVDAGLARIATKVVELNSGTVGAYPGTALVLGAQTVAQLPAAAAGTRGARATVTDATATTFMSIVAGTGANIVPVFCNGTNWLIG